MFKGEVRRVRLNATMTQNVVTYTVEIVTDNKDKKLLPYLTANVKFIIDKRENVLAVPNAALRWSPPNAEAPAAASGRGGTNGSGRAASRPDRSDGPVARLGSRSRTTVWVLENGALQPVAVRPGVTDGTVTEVTSDELQEGDQVVVGEQVPGGRPGPEGGTNPFAPTSPFGGRRR
jgi:HlyD family secretion protein